MVLNHILLHINDLKYIKKEKLNKFHLQPKLNLIKEQIYFLSFYHINQK